MLTADTTINQETKKIGVHFPYYRSVQKWDTLYRQRFYGRMLPTETGLYVNLHAITFKLFVAKKTGFQECMCCMQQEFCAHNHLPRIFFFSRTRGLY